MSQTKKKLVTHLKELLPKNVDKATFTTGDGNLYRIFCSEDRQGYFSNTRYFTLKFFPESLVKTSYLSLVFDNDVRTYEAVNNETIEGRTLINGEKVDGVAEYLSNKLNGKPLKWKSYNYDIIDYAIDEEVKRRKKQQRQQKQQKERLEEQMKQKKKKDRAIFLRKHIKDAILADPSFDDVENIQDFKKPSLAWKAINHDYYQLGKLTGKNLIKDDIFQELIKQNQNNPDLVKHFKQLQGLDKFSDRLHRVNNHRGSEDLIPALNEFESFLQSKNCPNVFQHSWYYVIQKLIYLYIDPNHGNQTARNIVLKILKQILKKCSKEPKVFYKIIQFILNQLKINSDYKYGCQQLENALFVPQQGVPNLDQQEQKKFQTMSKKFLQAGKMQQNDQKWHTLNEIDALLHLESCPSNFETRWVTLITSLLQAYLESGSQGRDFIGQMLADILSKCRLENPQKFTVMKNMVENVLQGNLSSKSDQLRQLIVNQVYSLFQ